MIKKNRGFTLIEILIALTILAIVGALMAMGLNSAVRIQMRVTQKAERLAEVQTAMMIIERDIAQIINRPAFDATGQLAPAIVRTLSDNQPVFEFTRAGYINPFFLQNRSTLQRVRYSFQKNQLFRTTWETLDRTINTPLHSQLLLTNVTAYNVNLITLQNATGTPNQPTSTLPDAVEITLTLDDLGNIRRLIPLPRVLTS